MNKKVDDIRYVKLTNGQELVAAQQKEHDNLYEFLADAAVVFLVPPKKANGSVDPEAPPVVNIAPFAPFAAEDTIKINKNNILFNVKSNKELSDFYKQATGKATVLTPPEKGIIL